MCKIYSFLCYMGEEWSQRQTVAAYLGGKRQIYGVIDIGIYLLFTLFIDKFIIHCIGNEIFGIEIQLFDGFFQYIQYIHWKGIITVCSDQ